MRILAGTERGLVDVATGGVVGLAGRDVRALTDGADGPVAVLDGTEIVREVSDGEWQPVAEIDGAYSLHVPALGHGRDEIWVGTLGAHLRRVRDGAVESMESFDSAPGRDDWYTPAPPLHVRSFAEHTDLGRFASVHVGGILRTRDAGTTWAPTVDIDVDVHEVAVTPDGLLLAACGHEGLAVSADAGDTWKIETEGLHAAYARAVSVGGGRVFISVSRGPHGRDADAAVYSIEPPDGEFVKCHHGLPDYFAANIDSGCLAASGDRVAFGTADGEVFVSEDAGDHWELACRASVPVRSVLIAGARSWVQ